MRSAVHVLAILTLALSTSITLPATVLLMVLAHPVSAATVLGLGLSMPVLLVRWLDRQLAWGLPHPVTG